LSVRAIGVVSPSRHVVLVRQINDTPAADARQLYSAEARLAFSIVRCGR